VWAEDERGRQRPKRREESMAVVKVEVGQVWIDNDFRFQNPTRNIRVISIDGKYAVCESYGFKGRVRRVRIHLRRFRPTSTGYRFVAAHAICRKIC
jgi:hypothetical protein